MATKKWIIILIVIISVTQQIQSACVCNEKGEDACAACSEIRVVRPKPKYPKEPIALPPIGDNCSCSKTMIEPAALPKPCHKSKPPPPSCSCKENKPYKAPSVYSAPSSYMMPQPNYVPAPVHDGSPPADPISISLAIQAGKAIQVPEAKLAYGFVQKPINGLPKVYYSSVEEGNLYALNKDVITLKKPSAPKIKPLEDDYPEPEEEEHAPEDDEPPSLTYKQLGYVPEEYKNPKFQEVPSGYAYPRAYPAPSYPAPSYPAPSYPDPAYPAPAYPPTAVEGKVSVDCGFRPGRIAKYKQTKQYGPTDDYLIKY